MRHWHLGYPIGDFPPVAGRPCGYWITLFILSHRQTETRWERIAWPDGGPLLTQRWHEVMVFEIIRGESEQIVAERIRRQAQRGRRVG
ncbi:MAG: hypothetical protein IID61_16335 [SAR324 cluster bacterium]|nr:hypothetical protein [SAR324 cluster bacterium]